MEALGRVELPTNGLGNRCSIHLSYRAVYALRLSHALSLTRCCPHIARAITNTMYKPIPCKT